MVFELKLDTDTVRGSEVDLPLLIDATMRIHDVLKLLEKSEDGSVFIQQGGRLVGIFTERDAIRLMASGSDLDRPISSVMVSSVSTIEEGETVQSAITKMSAGGYRRLPVVDGDHRPLGMLKVSHILHYLVEHVPSAVYNLPPTPRESTQERDGA